MTLFKEYARMIYKANTVEELEKVEEDIFNDAFLTDKDRSILISKAYKKETMMW